MKHFQFGPSGPRFLHAAVEQGAYPAKAGCNTSLNVAGAFN